jgi:hypothetical protein
METEYRSLSKKHVGIQYVKYAGFEVLTAVVMKISIFCVITPCSPLKFNRRFAGTCRVHLQGRRIMKARNQGESRRQAEKSKVSWLYSLISQKLELYINYCHVSQ